MSDLEFLEHVLRRASNCGPSLYLSDHDVSRLQLLLGSNDLDQLIKGDSTYTMVRIKGSTRLERKYHFSRYVRPSELRPLLRTAIKHEAEKIAARVAVVLEQP